MSTCAHVRGRENLMSNHFLNIKCATVLSEGFVTFCFSMMSMFSSTSPTSSSMAVVGSGAITHTTLYTTL